LSSRFVNAPRKVVRALQSEGFTPVIVGTHALILQGWLPEDYIVETKDIDIYIPSPDVLVAIATTGSRLLEELEGEGFIVSLHATGGVEVVALDTDKPIKILYPIADIYIPRVLLEEVVVIEGLRVLEAHAALVAKMLGEEYSLMRVASILKERRIPVDVYRLIYLAERAEKELRDMGDDALASKLSRRAERVVGYLRER